MGATMCIAYVTGMGELRAVAEPDAEIDAGEFDLALAEEIPAEWYGGEAEEYGEVGGGDCWRRQSAGARS